MAGATADSLSPREAAQQIISRYVGQLLHGCGDSRCEEMMCASGRRNGSERPIRGYTARSARTIAITLASGPRPRSRLCPRYQPAGHPTKAGVEPPRDQSSLPQRLSDTNAIRGACGDPDGRYSLEHQERSTKDPQGPQDLERWRTMLENISSRDRSTDLEAEQTFALDVAKALFEGLQWFVGDTAAIKTYASDCARPASSDQYAPSCEVRGVAFQNRLQYEPAQELLHRTLAVVGQLTVSENEFVETLAPLLPRAGYWRPLVACLRHIFLRTWNGDVMLDGVASSAILLLEAIHRRCLETLNKATSTTTARLMNRALLGTSSTAARLDPLTVARSLRLPEAEGTTNLLRLSGPFTTVDKALWLRIFNQIRMSEAHGLAAANKNLHDEYERQVSAPDRRLQHLEEHYLFLNVSRSTALEDAFIQLWQRRKTELLRPLRVRMNEADDDAVGQDLGGVQIEFFNIVCRELFKEELQMFTSLESGYSYFRAGSLQSLYRFELCGVLFGLALHNGICLPVSLPMVFYHALLRDASCTDEGPRAIGDGWPTLARSLTSILADDVTGKYSEP